MYNVMYYVYWNYFDLSERLANTVEVKLKIRRNPSFDFSEKLATTKK